MSERDSAEPGTGPVPLYPEDDPGWDSGSDPWAGADADDWRFVM